MISIHVGVYGLIKRILLKSVNMFKQIFNTTDLTERQIQDLYSLHEQIYFKRGIGLNFKKWKQNLLKLYHNSTTKKVQIITDYFSNIKGYSIFTTPICIDGLHWSKILEGGLRSDNSQQDFIDMIIDLTESNWNEPIWFFGETSVESRIVLKLMKESGFNEECDISIIDNIFSTYLRSNTFKLLKKNGLCIKRKTDLYPNYFGKILVKEGGKVEMARMHEDQRSMMLLEV